MELIISLIIGLIIGLVIIRINRGIGLKNPIHKLWMPLLCFLLATFLLAFLIMVQTTPNYPLFMVFIATFIASIIGFYPAILALFKPYEDQ